MSEFVFKRYELKFLLTPEIYGIISAKVNEYMRADAYGETTIQSLYFDTPSFLLARRSLEKPPYKEKLRLRGYGRVSADEKAYLEIKAKACGVAYKRRIATTPRTAFLFTERRLDLPDGQIERELTAFRNRYEVLDAKALLLYDRTAYYTPESDFRITFDKNIRYRTERLTLSGGEDGSPLLPSGSVLLEVKTSSSIPLWLVQTLSETHTYKTSFSKYGSAYLREVQTHEQLFRLGL